MADSIGMLGEVAGDVLQRIVRELLARKAGGHLVEARLDRIEVRVLLALRGPRADPRAFSDELVATLDALLDEEIAQVAAFKPGHAFCHRCGTAGCDHSLPASSRQVFVGYAPTGVPLWRDFDQYCLEQRHPEIDRLYEDPPVFLTRVHTGVELRERLLKAFQAPSYDLRGQLIAGFFPLPTRRNEGRGVLALTFQVAASRVGGGRGRMGLNILGIDPNGEMAGRLWERYGDVPWRRGVRWAQSALSSVGASSRRRAARTDGIDEEEEIDDRVEGILQGLARRLTRDLRARTRRTRHAAMRHDTGERPTRQAVDDVRAAGPEGVLVDEKSGTLVVLGERGRTHFFTPDGRHVSSVRYSREAIARKRKLGLWRDASSEEARDLRASLV